MLFIDTLKSRLRSVLTSSPAKESIDQPMVSSGNISAVPSKNVTDPRNSAVQTVPSSAIATINTDSTPTSSGAGMFVDVNVIEEILARLPPPPNIATHSNVNINQINVSSSTHFPGPQTIDNQFQCANFNLNLQKFVNALAAASYNQPNNAQLQGQNSPWAQCAQAAGRIGSNYVGHRDENRLPNAAPNSIISNMLLSAQPANNYQTEAHNNRQVTENHGHFEQAEAVRHSRNEKVILANNNQQVTKTRGHFEQANTENYSQQITESRSAVPTIEHGECSGQRQLPIKMTIAVNKTGSTSNPKVILNNMLTKPGANLPQKPAQQGSRNVSDRKSQGKRILSS